MVSVRNNRIVLRDRKRNAVIAPTLTSAHNFDNTLNVSIYRFLVNLSRPPVAMGLPWGALASLSFLSRVRYGDVYLSLARWRILSADLKNALSAGAASEELREFKASNSLPDEVDLKFGDNFLRLDLTNDLDVDILRYEAGRTSVMEFEEALKEYSSPFQGENRKKFENEIIIPFFSEKTNNGLRNSVEKTVNLHEDTDLSETPFPTEYGGL